jgi:hypothetical protein
MRRLLLVALLALACDRPHEEDARRLAARALRGALTYPQSAIVTIAAGTDAAELRLTTAAPPEQVAAWYREALRLNGWQLRQDALDREGARAMYAEKDGRPLWISLRANTGGPGTTYTLVGAIIDSTTR